MVQAGKHMSDTTLEYINGIEVIKAFNQSAASYAAAWGEEYLHGTNSVENIIWRLRQKLEEDPKHPTYIKTVIRGGYKIVKSP